MKNGHKKVQTYSDPSTISKVVLFLLEPLLGNNYTGKNFILELGGLQGSFSSKTTAASARAYLSSVFSNF